MFQHSCLIQTGTIAENNDKTLTEMINALSVHLFPNFRSVEHSVGLNTRGRNEKLKKCFETGIEFCKEICCTPR